MLLLHDAAVELVALQFLGVENPVAPDLECAEALVQQPGLAAVEPQRVLRQGLEKAPIVADHHDRPARGAQHLLQVLNSDDVEMVGRLVEQEDVGLGREHASERCALRLATGELGRIFIAGEAEAFQHGAGVMRLVAGGKSGLDISRSGGEAGKLGVLRQIADGRRRLDETAAMIGIDLAGSDFQQRRFAGAVPADEAEPLAGTDG